MKNNLKLGNFTIHKPSEWDPDYVRIEINEYDYDFNRNKCQ